MQLQMKVLNLKQLNDTLSRISQAVIDPQSGIVKALQAGADEEIIPQVKRYIYEKFDTSGDFPAGVKSRKINQFRVDVEVQRIYAAVQEYGGTFPVTDKQRGFFWYKHKATGDDMWRALALSSSYTIPPRPYLRPAIDDKQQAAMKVAAWELRHTIAKAVR